MPKTTKQQKTADIVAARRAERAMQKQAKARKAQAEDSSPRGTIDPNKTYTRGALRAEFSLGFVWFREAQKRGLPVHPAGRTKFVSGSELITFINSGKGAAVVPRAKAEEAD